MLAKVICLVVLLLTPIHAVNVELTSNKQWQFTCPGEQVIFTCRVFGSVTLEWRSQLFTPSAVYLPNDRPPRTFTLGLFTIASLINVSTNGTSANTNFTSTLQVTASRMMMRDETTVTCLSITANKTDNFTVAEMPAAPLNVAVNAVRATGGGNVTITVIWMQPQNFDQFDIDRYDISVTSTSSVQNMTTACGECTSIVITVCENPSNVRMNSTFTATIAAVNQCGETGPTATASYTLITCGDPTPPRNGSIDIYQNTTEGAEIFFRCNSMFAPAGRMTATCTSNGMWTPDPGDLTCTFDCGQPSVPQHGTLESYTDTTEGSEVFYRCDPGLVPEGTMRAVCTMDGWSPNPADLTCNIVNCGVPRAPRNGSIENFQSISSVGGAQIVFRCNQHFVPAGRMSATCISPDGISINGTWTPDPADRVCNASDIVCEEPTTSSGVAVLEPHNTAVSSFIFYECHSGIVPSNSSSICGEDGMWSPDPSQVMCLEEPTTISTREASLSIATAIAITAIVCSLVMFITGALCGALLTVCISRWNKKESSSKPAPNTQEQHPVGTEEVQSYKIELDENVAYGPVEQNHMIELKENVAYGPVK